MCYPLLRILVRSSVIGHRVFLETIEELSSMGVFMVFYIHHNLEV